MYRHLTRPFGTIKIISRRRIPNHGRFLSSSIRVNGPASSAPSKDSKEAKPKIGPTSGSSCTENTVLGGLNYLKGQKPVLALKDEDYPTWLWNILEPKPIPDDGPGGKGEKMRLRAANKQRIKEQNFLKTQ